MENKIARIDAQGILREWGFLLHKNPHADEFIVPRDFAMQCHVWRTRDRGVTWEPVEPEPAQFVAAPIERSNVGFIRRIWRRIW